MDDTGDNNEKSLVGGTLESKRPFPMAEVTTKFQADELASSSAPLNHPPFPAKLCYARLLKLCERLQQAGKDINEITAGSIGGIIRRTRGPMIFARYYAKNTLNLDDLY